MKQVIQSARGGKLAVKSVVEPGIRPNMVLVRTIASLISAGTERQMVGFAQSTIISKAKARPDLVKKVLDKASRDGLISTIKSVVARLDEPLPLGYSAAGSVVEIGSGLEGQYRVGQLVAIAGAGIANHAELNLVPANLIAPVPSDVKPDEACFSTLSSIAMHAVRLASVELGDMVGVIGAGLVGQLVAQIARLAGGRVVVLDYDAKRLELAKRNGAEATVQLGRVSAMEAMLELTRGVGCDKILIAAATDSSEPFETAAEIARDRATVCLVGITGTNFPYRLFMQKELKIVVSRSYGPGRYDRDYENRHVKYPVGYVRWTESENLREVARLMSPSLGARLDVESLITHRFSFDDAAKAYDMVLNGTEPHLGVVLNYGSAEVTAPLVQTITLSQSRKRAGAACVIAAVGAGNFAKTMILPALKSDSRVKLHTLVTLRGMSSQSTGNRFGFEKASSNLEEVLQDKEVSGLVITTPHSSHASLVAKALRAGKNVFVEKPLALTRAELEAVAEARNEASGFFMVGFNRRFAPQVAEVRNFLQSRPGKCVLFVRVNAGQLAPESWQRDGEEGQGRILGELCHFIDLAMNLAGSRLVSVEADSADASRGLCEDVSVHLRFADGSLATIVYTTLGDTSFSKELIECYKGGAICRIENFREATIVANGKRVLKKSAFGQDKGHALEMKAFVDGVISGIPPVDEQSLLDSSLATLLVLDSLRLGHAVRVEE